MKKFTLMLVAGLFALAGSVQAQKKVVLSADDITIAKGETAELVIKMEYETTEEIGGTNFSLSFPDGLVLSGFSSKEEMSYETRKEIHYHTQQQKADYRYA